MPIRILLFVGMKGIRETSILIFASLTRALEKSFMNNLYTEKYDLCDPAKVCEAKTDLLHVSYKC